MSNNKIDFINDLLSSKKIKTEEKSRLIDLTRNEFKNFEADNSELKRRIDIIEVKLGINFEENKAGEIVSIIDKNDVDTKNKDSTSKENKLLKYINPFSSNGLVKFLEEYNSNEFLKYTWHTFDDKDVFENIINKMDIKEYDIVKYQEKIEYQLKNLFKNYFLKGKVKNFLLDYVTGKNYEGKIGFWTQSNVVNWNSENLINWSNQNKIVPNPGGKFSRQIRSKGYKLDKPIKSKLNGKRINYFSELIIYSKNLFRIQADNSLYDILIYNNEKYKNDCIFNYDNFEKTINLYTDVNSIIECFNIIIENTLDIYRRFNLEKPFINISFSTELNNHINLIVHHENVDYFKKNLNSISDRMLLGEKHIRMIEKINGICDLYLEAIFENNLSYKINLWDSKEIKAQEIEKRIGVKHILNFKV